VQGTIKKKKPIIMAGNIRLDDVPQKTAKKKNSKGKKIRAEWHMMIITGAWWQSWDIPGA